MKVCLLTWLNDVTNVKVGLPTWLDDVTRMKAYLLSWTMSHESRPTYLAL